jgi:hypothetical protein
MDSRGQAIHPRTGKEVAVNSRRVFLYSSGAPPFGMALVPSCAIFMVLSRIDPKHLDCARMRDALFL